MTLYFEDYQEWKDAVLSQGLEIETGPDWDPDVDMAWDNSSFPQIVSEYYFETGQGWIEVKEE